MPSRTWAVASLLFASGFCALAYQVSWLRDFRLIFGSSTAASAAVLAIFIGGLAAGDTLVHASAEVLVPLTAPLSFGKMGVSVFTDVGTAYNHDQRLSHQAWHQDWHQGVGAGVWFSAALLRVNVAVARGLGAGTRVHVGGGLSF